MSAAMPWMRLKLNADVNYVPDGETRVYFRNNVGSFTMEGPGMQSWIEMLLPVFNGTHTLESLTDGLPDAYRDKIYDVAGILVENGFVRDVSTDKPHQLPQSVLQYYAPQIEFVDNRAGSGAFRFQTFRDSNILMIGSGPMLRALALSLLESGAKCIHFIEVGEATSETPLRNVIQAYHQLDPAVHIHNRTSEMSERGTLHNLVQAMDAVIYVSQTGDLDALRRFESVCQAEQRWFLSAVIMGGVGFAMGPHQGGPAFDSAWRRVHPSMLRRDLNICQDTDTAAAILANVIAFELFKHITGIDSAPAHRLYVLNTETLEGEWHPFIPAPLAIDDTDIQPLDVTAALDRDAPSHSMHEVLSFFSTLTNEITGIFHVWDEGSLRQLPLSQCRVQPIDGQSSGPAALLPETVCTGFTHDDARYEAGLVGIEAYAQKLLASGQKKHSFLGIGTGMTMAEAIGRGLEKCLIHEVKRSRSVEPVPIRPFSLATVQDEKCQFYLQAIRRVCPEPMIGQSDDIRGLPTVWVGIDGHLIGKCGMSICTALTQTLEKMLLCVSQGEDFLAEQEPQWLYATSADVRSDGEPQSVDVGTWSGFDNPQVLSALSLLAKNGRDVVVYDLSLEPFLTEELAGVVGVCFRGEELG